MDKGLRHQGKNVQIFYLNDDGEHQSARAEILYIDTFVTFKTSKNIITIPAHRVLKIKEEVNGSEE